MAKTEVILTGNVDDLGAEADRVEVASGYARNYLIPQGLAVPLTAANARRLEVLRVRREERESHELQHMKDLASSVAKLVLPIKVKTGDEGKLFGSVTAANIIDELKSQFEIELDRKKVHLDTPIRELGRHEVELRLHHDIKASLKLQVDSTNPVVLAARHAEAKAAAEEQSAG